MAHVAINHLIHACKYLSCYAFPKFSPIQGKFNVRDNSEFFEECKVLFPVKEQIFQADIPCQNGATNYY